MAHVIGHSDGKDASLKPPSAANGGPSEKSEIQQLRGRLERAERELIDARENSERALRAKSEFLSNMSHELRTPLNAIIGMTEVLGETRLDDQQRRYLDVLDQGSRNLLNLINDILSHAQLESGRMPVEVQPFRPAEVADNVAKLLRPRAEDKELKLRVEGTGGTDDTVMGDAKKVEQILLNLVGNAVKFTTRGEVVVTLRKAGESSDDYVFSVRDTGIGIEPEKMGELFNRFSQLDASITKTYGGTGLGLAISKQLVELLGGTMWVESKCDVGSVFSFRLRLPRSLEQIAAPPPEAPKLADLGRRRILLVEDSRDNAFLISTYLRPTNAQLDFAENGRVAVEKFEGNHYDLILMDMQMPEMDGYSATRWIRLLERRRPRRTPILALTAFAFKEEIEKSLTSGCDGHLSKPIGKMDLIAAIAKWTEGPTGH